MDMSTSPPENEGLACELDVMWQSYQRARDDLFGAHLASIIKRVSPVAVDALAAEGLRVDEVVDRFRPPTDWPEMPLRLHDTFRPLRFSSLVKSPRRGRNEERRFARRHLAGAGCVVRDAGEGASGLGVRLTGNGIEVAILTDDYLLTTAAGKGRLQVTGALPLTIGGAMLGRPVGDFVDHPLLNGRDYRVRGVTQMVGEGTTLIVFDTGSRRYARR